MVTLDEEIMQATALKEAQSAGEAEEPEEYGSDEILGENWRRTRTSPRNQAEETLAERLDYSKRGVASMGTGRILYWSWMMLIPSFGLTLIYINIHYFFAHIVGSNIFCKFGEEWVAVPGGKEFSVEIGKMSGGSVGMLEKLVLLFLDLLIVCLILLFSGVILLIIDFATGIFGGLVSIAG